MVINNHHHTPKEPLRPPLEARSTIYYRRSLVSTTAKTMRRLAERA